MKDTKRNEGINKRIEWKGPHIVTLRTLKFLFICISMKTGAQHTLTLDKRK